MGTSIIEVQRNAILKAIRDAGRGKWKVLVLDQGSQKLVENVMKEDEILNEHITNIEQIEQRRQTNREIDAIYLLTPEPHIVECVVADIERRRYRQITLLWTSLLPPNLKEKIDKCKYAREMIMEFRALALGYFPKESNLITFRDPWSFPILYHPQCNNLVRQHMSDLAHRIVSVCVSLGEYPTIRFYQRSAASHEARVLCSFLARAVQEEIDRYATYHHDFPPPSSRPRATLYVLDRSLDLVAGLVHEFTYQAMVYDLLPIKDGDKVTYKVSIAEGNQGQVEKELEISEADHIWTSNRHKHMKDTIDTLMAEFQKFLADNPHFAKESANATSLNTIKNMLVGLPQFQAKKEAYSLHLSMAQGCMNMFERMKLPDVASVEQSLATGLDEEYKKPKNLSDQLVRTLDEDAIIKSDRLRLLLLYLIYRDGLLPADTTKLLAHAQLPPGDGEVVFNLSLLGQKINRGLKDPRPPAQPMFPRKPPPINLQEDYSLSRFQPALKSLLEEHCRGTLDQDIFPYTKPQLDPSDNALLGEASTGSLRGAKPTWAKSKGIISNEPRQRILVFMAGGATFSESRACYEIGKDKNKEVYLITSHMLTPSLFVRQIGDLSVDKKRLGIPAELSKPQAPAHLFEPEPVLQPPSSTSSSTNAPNARGVAPPTADMASLRVSSNVGDGRQQNGQRAVTPIGSIASEKQTDSPEKPTKDQDKKKRLFFSSRK